MFENNNNDGGSGSGINSPLSPQSPQSPYQHHQQQQQQQQPTTTNRINRGSSNNKSSNNSDGWVEKVKLFDFYPKVDDDVPRHKSTFGGVATMICILITAYLLVSEIYFYTFPIREHSLRVDITRGNRLPINIDIHFPRLVCTDITIDVVDGIDGKPIKDAAYQIVKQRLDSHGEPFAQGVALAGKKGIFSRSCTECEFPKSKRLSSVFYKQKCCNSCEDLRQYYRLNRIPQNLADDSPQCLIERPIQDDEGCRIYGSLSVQKMKGDFHILAGTGSDESHDGHAHHVHHITRENVERVKHFNITHHIHKFSFGEDIEGLINPLEDFGIVAQSLAVQTYYLQVVPAIYKKNDFVLETNQYSYTYDYRVVNMFNLGRLFPGIYFKYDLSPLMIEVDQTSKPLVELITSICAIGGGMYVVLGLVVRLSEFITNLKKK
ncbi:hypothetical protein ACTFIV_010478 [Dictyostelium citrinum]